MSRIFSALMPAKKLPRQMSVQNMERMVQETCIVELIHGLLGIMGLDCPLIWKSIGGWILFALYLLGNIPFILIQRYKRPKLVRLLKRLQITEKNRRLPMKKVLILSCSTGQGHNSCAQAMMDYYKKQNVECEIQDSLDFIGKRISRFLSWGHSFVYCHLPWLFRWGYRQSEKHPAVFKEGSLVYKALTSGADRMNQYITEGNYTTVICTHIFSAMMLTHVLQKHPSPIHTAFVAIDYTSYPGANICDLQRFFIADDSFTDDFVRMGIQREKVIAAGIPVRRAFYNHTKKADAKRLLGIRSNSKHLLIMCGSMGCGPIAKMMKRISKEMSEDMEGSIVCGTNKRLFKRLGRRYKRKPQIHVIGYRNVFKQFPVNLYDCRPLVAAVLCQGKQIFFGDCTMQKPNMKYFHRITDYQ